ncbi:MAG TPA: peptidoglycan-binding domain-containing protein [Casimicrobiaceae bacterium]
MENTLKLKRTARYATAAALALGLSAAYAASDSTTPTSGSAPTNPSSGTSATAPSAGDSTTAPSNGASSTRTQSSGMTGKQKATAIGATGGAVAGAVVGGPVGAVIGAGVGGYVGHEGTDAKGHVPSSNGTTAANGDGTVRRAQEALNAKGYSPGAIDGRLGPNTESAIRSFQEKNGIAATGTLDNATQSALGI